MKTNLCSVFLVLYISFLFAQEVDSRYLDKEIFPFGVVERINSGVLNEMRILNIYLPEGYSNNTEDTYPTIYVLDGSANEDFPHIAGLVQFLNMYNIAPKSIVVGIANVNRYRDFTFPSKYKDDLETNPANGGSPKFIDFIENEVQPFMIKNYKTNGHKTIIGQSLGGLLATEILIKNEHLFEDYIIVSPSLWWNHQKLVDSAAKYFQTHLNLKKKVFVSLGKEHPVMHEVADKLVDAIKSSENSNIELHYLPILEEDHATILHKAVYEALKALNEN